MAIADPFPGGQIAECGDPALPCQDRPEAAGLSVLKGRHPVEGQTCPDQIEGRPGQGENGGAVGDVTGQT